MLCYVMALMGSAWCRVVQLEFQWRQHRGGSAAGEGRGGGYDALGGRCAQLGGGVEPVVLRIDAAGFVTNRIIHEEVAGRNTAPGSGG
jgi:hypothetical protein